MLKAASLAALAAALLTLTAVAPAARAADTLAPRGADPSWLPNEPWVQQRWLPYHESTLYAALHTNTEEIRIWLTNPRRTLAGLARSKGLSVGAVERRLDADWANRQHGALRRALRNRVHRTLTQSHLMRHMMFHTFHMQFVTWVEPVITGVDFQHLPSALPGHTIVEVGAAHGRTAASMRATVVRALKADAREGVRLRATPPDQARAWLRSETAGIGDWFGWRYGGGSATASTARFTCGAQAPSS